MLIRHFFVKNIFITTKSRIFALSKCNNKCSTFLRYKDNNKNVNNNE
nr:MAG TPA: hypothetical protein [Caudoviricetes sp.]